MYISDKIVAHGKIVSSRHQAVPGDEYVIIKAEDYPNEIGMRRTTYYSSVGRAKICATDGGFDYSSSPDYDGAFVGVEVSRLKKVRPAWCITEADLLAQYTAMQREQVGPIPDLDLRKDPELLTMAKRLWSKAVSNVTKST